MIPGNVLEGHMNGAQIPDPLPQTTVIGMLLQDVEEWAVGMTREALQQRLLACAIPPNGRYDEWRDVLSRCAYPVQGEASCP